MQIEIWLKRLRELWVKISRLEPIVHNEWTGSEHYYWDESVWNLKFLHAAIEEDTNALIKEFEFLRDNPDVLEQELKDMYLRRN